MDLYDSGYGVMAGFCENNIDLLSLTRGREILDKLSQCQSKDLSLDSTWVWKLKGSDLYIQETNII